MKQPLKKIILFTTFLTIAFFGFIIQARAQGGDTTDEFQKEFDEFQKSIRQEFEAFKSKNDSIFYQFLLENWKEYELMKDKRKTVPKPKVQPRADTATPRKVQEIKPLQKRKTMLEDTGRQIQYQLVPDKYNAIARAKPYSTLDFYGSRIEVQKVRTTSVLNDNEVSQQEIAGFFRDNASNDELLAAIQLLEKQAAEKGFNAWGFLKLLQDASPYYFNTPNEQVMFTWFALLKTGYDVKAGYNKKNVFLLVNFDVPVYYLSYLLNDGKKYYVISFPEQPKKQASMVTFPESYPGDNQPVSLKVYKNASFPPETMKKELYFKNQKIKLTYNRNMVDFYETYPDCELPVYFPPPPSNTALKSLSAYFKPLFKGKTQMEKVAVLLDFVQMDFPYKSDEDQFGKEKYFFSEETIAGNYSDCEDRAILLGQLIKYFTGLKSIGLVFPGHVSLAVNLPENIRGSYINYHDARYYVCDPTYLGSKPGMLMPGFENKQPEIINFQ